MTLRPLVLSLLVSLVVSSAFAADPAPAAAERKPGDYLLTADSLVQEGVPPGKLEGPFEFRSANLPGTVRRYWIFIPAQYTGDTPANLLVFHDGQRATNPNGSLRIQNVLANLIHKKEIPVTIGLFITPGHIGDAYPDDLGMSNPNNRAAEYDALNDAYARMICFEFIPLLKKTHKITDDPEARAIGGTSSGAICAFTTAWEFPNQFRNVISMIGSYVSIGYRPAKYGSPMTPGGDLYPTLIRKTPIKPIRIYLQDGSNDLSNDHGNWFLANQQMLSAFEFANAKADRMNDPGPRYRVKHEWGDGHHSDAHGGQLLPDILRWMWGQ